MEKNLSETTLLDSSLKSKYSKTELSEKMYDTKVIDCGDYIQIYVFEYDKFVKDKSFIDIKKIDTENLYKKSNTINELKSIMLSNAIRSNISIQRLARCNYNSWNTFITLTFADNLKDISIANKKFNCWISNVRKLKKDFKYLAVPEFQKRGAVHYHLLSNLDYDDGVIVQQKEKKGRAKNIDSLYDIKYWSYGFCRVDFITGNYEKVYKYLTKYMTKDIDNKLFGKKRYLFSQNLVRPVVSYISSSNENDKIFVNNLLNDKDIDYDNHYFDSYTKHFIRYIEYKKKSLF